MRNTWRLLGGSAGVPADSLSPDGVGWLMLSDAGVDSLAGIRNTRSLLGGGEGVKAGESDSTRTDGTSGFVSKSRRSAEGGSEVVVLVVSSTTRRARDVACDTRLAIIASASIIVSAGRESGQVELVAALW
jgi:hypothetical protein